jgi:hypothetical protein
MKRFLVLPLLLAAGCAISGGSGAARTVTQRGHGALTIEVVPNPIVAQHVSGNAYTFPFDVVVRETGGHSVNITRVTADVNALGSIHLASDNYDAARIRSLGYATTVPPNGELRYHFAPQKSVSDDRLFGSVNAELRVDGVDDSGTPASAKTTMTITR